jgi:hypothetical protein
MHIWCTKIGIVLVLHLHVSYKSWYVKYLTFFATLENVSLMWRCRHCRWRAAKFRLMLCAQSLWAGRDLSCETPVVTRNLGFPGFIRSTVPFCRHLRQARGYWGPIILRILTGSHSVSSSDTQGNAEDKFLPRSSRVMF